MLELLPSNTRRVFISNSSSHENGIINTAIELGGDVLLTANELLDTENLEGIIRTLEQKGYANDAEINQRGRTIENVNGIKEGIRTAPERQADDRYFDYSDEYYKSGKE